MAIGIGPDVAVTQYSVLSELTM